MKAILIDPIKREIREVDITDGDSPAGISNLIGCRWFCIGSYLRDGDAAFVDDEGLLLGEEEDIYFWAIDSNAIKSSNNQPLAGKGLVLGSDEEGCSQSAVTTVDELASAIRWLGPARAELGHQISATPFAKSENGGAA